MNALPEPLLDEAENFKPVAEIVFDPLSREVMHGEERFPTLVGCTIFLDARRKHFTQFRQARRNFFRRGFNGTLVFFANLLFDKGAADQLIQGQPRGKFAATIRFENREPHFILKIAGQDHMFIDNGNGAIEDHRCHLLRGSR